MEYISTRSKSKPVSAAQAIVSGIAPDGGLYVPRSLPHYLPDPERLKKLSYGMIVKDVFRLFAPEFSGDEITEIIKGTYYTEKFDKEIAPCISVGNMEILELWHGPTASFKDMALQIMPQILQSALKKIRAGIKETVILVATSGDTGKAAIEGFKNLPGTKVIVFYPASAVSSLQELQMITSEGDNIYVVGVEGNFDDCQAAIKKILNDKEIKERMRAAGKRFSSANSINWSRLLPQIVYYYYGYSRMLAKGVITPRDRINIVVPTGNFGNILAAFYALRMGLPVHRLICASNENKVLTEAITKGSYNCQRTLYQTTSPAMDILVSSNFERFLFEMANRDHVLITNWYQKLDKEGNFTIPDSVRNRWQKLLIGEYATEEEADDALRETFEEHHYLADPHTAVAISVYNRYIRETNDNHKTMLVSTANPYKFPDSILIALGEKGESLVDLDEQQLVDRLAAKTGQPVHKAIAGVLNKEVLHQRQVAVQDIGAGIMELLSI